MDEPPRNPRYFRRFLAYALDYRGLLALAVLMGVLKFGMNYTFPWLIGSAVDTIAPRQVSEKDNDQLRAQITTLQDNSPKRPERATRRRSSRLWHARPSPPPSQCPTACAGWPFSPCSA